MFIVIIGLLGYRRSMHRLPLMLAIVFGLFGASHALVLIGSCDVYGPVVFTIRVVGYGLVIYMLYRYVRVLDIF